MRTECDRGGQRWHAREVLEPKDESWMYDIARETLEVAIQNNFDLNLYALFSIVCGGP